MKAANGRKNRRVALSSTAERESRKLSWPGASCRHLRGRLSRPI
jgi:hypothetical protein